MTGTPKKRRAAVSFPSELEGSDFSGTLRGFYHADSNEYNVVGWGDEHGNIHAPKIGLIASGLPDATLDETWLLGLRDASGLTFIAKGQECKKQPYTLLLNIFSRNTGILESSVMLDKTAIISGCGSVGSMVALELARAGVGKFVLIDNDTVAYHNLSRHQCGTNDVGKFKVSAVSERIRQINPIAKVEVFSSIIEDISRDVFDVFCTPESIIVGCGDNRESDVYANKIACLYRIPLVSIGLWQRAFAGEIFYTLPGEQPCYACSIGEHSDGINGRKSTSRRFYVADEKLAETQFEPGISVDIGFVTNIAIKLILDLLNRRTDRYVPRVINHLQQFTLVCNSSDERLGGEQAEIFSYPLQITTSIQTGFRGSCPPCKLTP